MRDGHTKVFLEQKGVCLKGQLKFMFSKKATKIDEIYTVDLTLCSKTVSVKLTLKNSSFFVGFLENTNFNFKRAF